MLKLKEMSVETQAMINELADSLYGLVNLEDYDEEMIEVIISELEYHGIDTGLYFDDCNLLCGILQEFEETEHIHFEFDSIDD